MEKILLVEDNKTLAKLIARKIKETLQLDVDVAYSLQEAKLFLKAYQYFLCLLDLNLPDAPNGEVVDYALEKEQHIIVLSGNINKELRRKILQKEVIDYVTKGGMNDINYIIQTISRLQKNTEHTVLVVDDSMITRKHMKTLLENLFFKVITVAHGEEAIGILQTNPNISLVVTDYKMPVMNGLELTLEIRKSYKKDELSIVALSSGDDDEINAMFLKHGANDYISKPFSKEEFSCRINNTIEALENLNIVTNHINRDFLTGLYNKKYFFSYMGSYIEEIAHKSENYALGMINIDNFKNITDSYGYEIGDKVIVHLSEVLTSNTNYHDIVARFGDEEFCVVLKNVNRHSAEDVFERLRDKVRTSYIMIQDNQEIRFSISIGAIMSSEDSLEEIIDRADMMLYKTKQESQDKVVFD